MQSNPFVSVVMPCYNAEKYIRESIESVIKQTFLNWELIIVNDGSKDNTISIIQEYASKDPRIRCIDCPVPSGSPAEPRNIGIRESVGRYIAFLDSDDIWTPDKLDSQLELFSKGDYIIVYCDYESITENGERMDRKVKEPDCCNYKQLLRFNCIGCSEAIIDTEKIGKPQFKKIGHEDYLFWLEIMKNGGMAINTNQVQLLYRERTSSVSGNKLQAAKWAWNIYRKELNLPLYKAYYCFTCYMLKALERHGYLPKII